MLWSERDTEQTLPFQHVLTAALSFLEGPLYENEKRLIFKEQETIKDVNMGGGKDGEAG